MAPCAVSKFALCLDEVLALHTFRLDSCSKALLHPMCCAVPSALCRLVCHNWASAPWAPVLRTIQNCSIYFLGALANNSARFPIYVVCAAFALSKPGRSAGDEAAPADAWTQGMLDVMHGTASVVAELAQSEEGRDVLFPSSGAKFAL